MTRESEDDDMSKGTVFADDAHVLVSTSSSGVRTLRLNRTASRNALSIPMREALLSTLADAGTDPGVRCVVLRGDRSAFSAGGDVRAMDRKETPMETVQRMESGGVLVRAVYDHPKPVVAAVEGPAVGAGLSLVLASDIVVASGGASFSAAFIKRGLVPDTGLSYLLAKSVGVARAKHMVLTGEIFDAEAAERMGMVAVHAEGNQFEDRLTAVTMALAEGPTAALSMTKRMLNRALESDLESALTLEAFGQAVARTTEDHRESVRSFIARESPRFIGR